jgi:acetyl esterase/lipase
VDRNPLQRRPGALLAALAKARPDGLAAALMGARSGGKLGRFAEHLVDHVDASPNPGGFAIELPPGASIDRDLAYGDDPAQRLDLYRPANAQGSAPLLLFVHGGGWRRGDKAMSQMIKNKAPHWLSQGCLFASTNYRLLPAADVIEQARDVARALAFVQGHAADWGGDPARVVLVGHSAGAHLAALLTADDELARQQGAQPWLATVALDSAALDMAATMAGPHYRFYDAVFGDDPAFWRTASPTLQLAGRQVAPMLMVCSSDREDSLGAASEFAQRATGLGGQVQLLPVALSHAEINDQLGTPGAYTSAVDEFLHSVGLF